MLRSDLIDRLIQRNPQLSPATVEQAVKMLLEHMSETLAADGRIEIRGFGSFNVRKRPARLARNPKTGESVPVGEHARVSVVWCCQCIDPINEENEVCLLHAGWWHCLGVRITPALQAVGNP